MLRLRRLFRRLQKLLEVLREPRYRRALRHGVAASTEHDAVPLRRDFSTILDVGANRGQFAVFADRRFPGAALICFEPLDEARSRLRKVMAGRSNVRVLDVALSDHTGTGEFHVSKADDSSSLLPIGRLQRESFRGTEERARVAVQIGRLDGVLGRTDLVRPVLLKVDVQGGELAVLRGAGELLDAVDAILVEASFVELYEGQPLADDVWAFLHTAGFASRGIWSAAYGSHGECLQGDFLFSRTDFDPFS